ncbi:MAG: Prenyltransferase and squalene oxidase repeat protein [Methanomassiliicoccales archaeon PtaU1.Bin124]|nr:MAG: Prenyltransferase and squalene oxidase repeat protein [Methanomassiliicoccales archaeon PtaU1.Bin124]
MDWRSHLQVDPLPYLLITDDEALAFRVRRDLLGESELRREGSWLMPEVGRLMKRQREDGSWRYPGGRSGEALGEDYDFLQTYKIMALLVECYDMDRTHPMVARAAEALLSRQTEEGDLRGIYGNQYSPNYTAGASELMIKAGYAKDPRIKKVFEWLLRIRQNDGGWALPLRTRGNVTFREAMVSDPIPPDTRKPSSYLMTGVVLRAFAADKKRARTREAREAGELLKRGFFKAEPYDDRKAPSYWTQFTFPFFFNDLNASLDVLSKLGFPGDDPDIMRAVDYFRSRQRPNGSFDLKLNLARGKDVSRWGTYALCRSLCRFYGACKA